MLHEYSTGLLAEVVDKDMSIVLVKIHVDAYMFTLQSQ